MRHCGWEVALAVAGVMGCFDGPAAAQTAAADSEARAVRAFERAKGSPLELRAFLERMPKGGDLHMHLSGAVYAETFIADAAADGLCVDPVALSLVKNVGMTSGRCVRRERWRQRGRCRITGCMTG